MGVALQEHIEKDGFRLRGLEMSRIDAFSDVVFGFALTLLVVSSEVPKTFAELHQSMRGFFPFAVVFYFLIDIWYSHYKFFRRFGTHDDMTVFLNALLLFVVLYYVYPLKFLFTFLTYAVLGSTQHYFDNSYQVRELMILYGVGFTAINVLFASLYANGLRQRTRLGLSSLELKLARSYVTDSLGVASVGVLSCGVAMAVPVAYSGYSGMVYMLLTVFKWAHGYRTRKMIERYRALRPLAGANQAATGDGQGKQQQISAG
jgi:hypothetical protein